MKPGRFYSNKAPTRDYHRSRLTGVLTFREDIAVIDPEVIVAMFSMLPADEVRGKVAAECQRRRAVLGDAS